MPFLPVRAAQSIKRGVAARLLVRHTRRAEPAGRRAARHRWRRTMGRGTSLATNGLISGVGCWTCRPSPTRQCAARAAAFLLAPGNEDQVAVRDGRAFAPRIALAPHAPGAALQWRTDGAYLLTGGFGDVGLAIARAMVEEGARRLILSAAAGCRNARIGARSTLFHARSSALRQCARWKPWARPCIAFRSMCPTKPPSMFPDEYEADGWPPIRGVVHLAAVLDRRLISDTTTADFEVAIASKLRSAQVLDRLLPELDCFVMFSSMSTFLPNRHGRLCRCECGIGGACVRSACAGRLRVGCRLGPLARRRHDQRRHGRHAHCRTGATWPPRFRSGAGRRRSSVGPPDAPSPGSRSLQSIGQLTPRHALGRSEPLLSEVKGATNGAALAENLDAMRGAGAAKAT